jgi:hypothetical protein
MALTAQTPSILSTGSYLYDGIQPNGAIAGVEFVDPNDIAAAGARLLSLPTQAVIPRSSVVDDSWAEAAIRKKWIETVNDVIDERPHAA